MSLSTPRITIQLSATHVARNWEAAVERRRVCNLLGITEQRPNMTERQSLLVNFYGINAETAVASHLGVPYVPDTTGRRDGGVDLYLPVSGARLRLAIKSTINLNYGCLWNVPRKGEDHDPYDCDGLIFCWVDPATHIVTLRAGTFDNPETDWRKLQETDRFWWQHPGDMLEYRDFYDQLIARAGLNDLRAAG
jgi:hypothetical protein